MSSSRSEIFDNYMKIALEKGLVSRAQETPKESKELKDYKNSDYPRMGSDDISTIEALYGLKSKDQEYKNNIMEQAHPNACIIAPSYDKLNGLVENNIERQNIIINTLNKPVRGAHTNKKYAKTVLLKELIKTAQDMDNFNQEDLRKLADSCLDKLNQPIQKQAIAFLPAVGIFVGLSALIGAVLITNNTLISDQPVVGMVDSTLKQINDITDPDTWLHEDVPENLLNKLKSLQSTLLSLKTAAQKYNALDLSDIRKVSQLSNLETDSVLKMRVSAAKKTIEEYEAAIKLVIPMTEEGSDDSVIDALEFAEENSSEKGYTNWYNVFKKVKQWALPTDKKDIVRYLSKLNSTLTHALEELGKYKKEGKKRADKIQREKDVEKQEIQTPISEKKPDVKKERSWDEDLKNSNLKL